MNRPTEHPAKDAVVDDPDCDDDDGEDIDGGDDDGGVSTNQGTKRGPNAEHHEKRLRISEMLDEGVRPSKIATELDCCYETINTVRKLKEAGKSLKPGTRGTGTKVQKGSRVRAKRIQGGNSMAEKMVNF